MYFRKSTILIFALLLIILECTNLINGTPHPDDLSLYSNDNKELICIADGHLIDSAIDWIYPIPDSLKEVPQICKFILNYYFIFVQFFGKSFM